MRLFFYRDGGALEKAEIVRSLLCCLRKMGKGRADNRRVLCVLGNHEINGEHTVQGVEHVLCLTNLGQVSGQHNVG